MRRLVLGAGLVLTGVLTWLALRQVSFPEVGEALRESDAAWVVPAFAALAVAVLLRAVRWRAVFVGETRPPLGPVSAALLVGYFFNNVLPFRAGEAARLVDLNRRTGTSRTQIAATIAVERVYDVAALLLLLFALLPLLPDVRWIRTAAWLAVALGTGIVAAVAVLVVFGERALRVLLWPLRWLPFVSLERWESAPGNLARGLAALRELRVATAVLGWTVASWLVLGASAWLLSLGFDLDLPFEGGLFVMIATGLAMAIPSPPAALGVFEWATIVALGAYGIDASHALSYALVLHALGFLPFIVAGLVALPTGRRAVGRVVR